MASASPCSPPPPRPWRTWPRRGRGTERMVTQVEFCDVRDTCWKVYAGRGSACVIDVSGPALCGYEAGGVTLECDRRPLLLKRTLSDSSVERRG